MVINLYYDVSKIKEDGVRYCRYFGKQYRLSIFGPIYSGLVDLVRKS